MDDDFWKNEIKRALECKGEQNHLDFKTELSENGQRLKEHINAFGNSPIGGCFVFSVHKMGAVGLPSDPDQVFDRLSKLAKDTQEPTLNSRNLFLEYMGKKLLGVIIEPGHALPVFIKDRAPLGGEACFKRTGAATINMSIQEIRDLLSRSSTSSYDECPLNDVKISDLNLDLIRQSFSNFPDVQPLESATALSILRDYNVVTGTNDDPKVTVAGFLTFANDLSSQRTFRNAFIEFQIFRTSTREAPIRKQAITGALPIQIKNTIDLLLQHVWTVPNIKGIQRQDIPAYSEEVLREVITNSVVHRDYTKMHQPVKIALFSNRLEIENPGGLMPGLTALNLIHKRDWRNPLLAQLISKVGLGEMDGQGIDRLYTYTQQLKVPAPVFTDNKTSFKVTLSGPKSYDEFSQEERHLTVIILLAMEDQIENESVRNAFGIDQEKATTLITSLVEKGIIVQKNKSRKYAKYELSQKYKERIFD